MKPIKDRYEELCKNKMNVLNNDVLDTLSIINKEYFDNTLNIKLIDHSRFIFLVQINGHVQNDYSSILDEDLYYLQDLYDLYSLKRKINKINEKVIYDIITNDYFNNEFKIKMIEYFYDEKRKHYYFEAELNNKIFIHTDELFDHLENLYQLMSLKHKIERIYENS